MPTVEEAKKKSIKAENIKSAVISHRIFSFNPFFQSRDIYHVYMVNLNVENRGA